MEKMESKKNTVLGISLSSFGIVFIVSVFAVRAMFDLQIELFFLTLIGIIAVGIGLGIALSHN